MLLKQTKRQPPKKYNLRKIYTKLCYSTIWEQLMNNQGIMYKLNKIGNHASKLIHILQMPI